MNLGPCSIRHFKPEPNPIRPEAFTEGWYVVKYTSEVKIPLRGFSDVDARKLSTEFGIQLRREPSDPPPERADFYSSNAFKGLKQWVRAHPRKARQLMSYQQDYLPDWYERAIRD